MKLKRKLKDEELQRKLDEISDGAFTPAFNGCGGEFDECKEDCSVWFGPRTNSCRYKYVATFTKDEVEEVTQYDPENWNEWPALNRRAASTCVSRSTSCDQEVTGNLQTYKAGAKFVDGKWVSVHGFPLTIMKGGRLRFRPWVGPEEEE